MFRFLLLIVILQLAAARFFTEDVKRQKNMWAEYKKEHGRTYTHDEDSIRFGHFLRNIRLADGRNEEELARGGDACHGITKYSDWSRDEILSLANSKKPEGHVSSAEKAQIVSRKKKVNDDTVTDWTGVYTTPVKNQGQCGSCWAFSATEQIESDTMRTLDTTLILSPEQIVQCATAAYGCNGGWTEVAYSYVKKTGGLELEDDYPYTSPPTGKCNSDADDFKVTVVKFYQVDSEDDMGDYVNETGPLSVCVDAETWSSYTGGIMSVCGNSVDHCVQAVGVKSSGSDPYWKVRNSWGTSWGESGFIRLAYGKDTCAIASDATYTAVKLA
jgi:C1A family cysteine protease